MTCGRIEENLDNNRMMARALAAQGYDVTFARCATCTTTRPGATLSTRI